MSEEYGPNFVALTDEEGNDIELEYIDALEHNGTTYMAFFPVVEEGEEENEDEYGLIILKSETVDGGDARQRRRRGRDQRGLRPLHGADDGGRGGVTSLPTDFSRRSAYNGNYPAWFVIGSL